MTAVIARNFSEYLWLLAEGVGPAEAVYETFEGRHNQSEFQSFAEKYATTSSKLSAKEVIAEARNEFPDFEKKIQSIIK